MPTLRNVSKTFTFEEQRVEINEIAQDLYDLTIQEQDDVLLQHFRVDQNSASGGGSLTYSVEPGTPLDTGVFDYTPPDLSQFLTTETDPVFGASPAASITSNQISNWDATYNLVNSNFSDWNTAYSWGDHGVEGYLKSVYIPTDDSAPSNPVDGTLWWKSDEGRLKIYYEDINSSQWVDTGINGGGAVFFNDIANVNITAPLTNGQILIYDQPTQTWINSTFAAFGGAITWNDLFVGPDGTATGSGGLAYDNTNGEFTYTPPDLGAYWQTDLVKIANWDAAYNWGDHHQQGYWVADNTKITNWDTAYNWGDHSQAGYLLGIGSFSIKALADVETWTGTPPDNAILKFKVSSGFWEIATDTTNETDTLDDVTTRGNTTSNSITAGSFTKETNTGGFLKADGTEDTSTYWVADNTKISNWDTAHSWGDHSTQGYLTTINEQDTLATVTGRGSTTTNNIQVQNLQATGTVSDAAGNLRDAINAVSGGGGGGGASNDPIGTIVMWSGAANAIPSAYQLCDGSTSVTAELQAITANVPDLRDKFIVGAGNNYDVDATGGSADAVLVSHDHGGTSNAGSHNHSMNSAGNHGHGSGQTGNQSSNHYHTFNTSTAGSHDHRWGANTFAGQSGSNFDALDNPQGNGGGNKSADTSDDGAHSHSGTTAGVTQDHYHTFSINNGGDHTHSINNGGDHSHTISSDGVSASNANLPPYYSLCYIIKHSATAAEIIPRPFTTISTDTTSSHTLLASDMWKVVKITSPGGSVNLSLTIPDLSASLSFGDEVRILNGANESINVDASALSNLYWAQSGINSQNGGYSTGNREIAGYALITLTYRGSNEWNIHGDGVF